MRQRALHSAAGVTRPDSHEQSGGLPVDRSERHRPPTACGLPASPTPDRGLAPTGTETTVVADGPLTAVESQRFRTVPLRHETALTLEAPGATLHATLRNTSEQAWAYRVPRGPAPFAGGRVESVESDERELRVRPLSDDGLFSDGVLGPGESVRSTLSIAAVSGVDGRLPRGEYAFQQPLRVWTAETTYGYNWQVSLVSDG